MEIIVKHGVPPFDCRIEKIDTVVWRRTVNQGINTSPLIPDLLYKGLSRLGIRYVTPHSKATGSFSLYFIHGFYSLIFTGSIANRNKPTLVSQGKGNCASNTPSTARY